jgi:hypothetical protein
MIPTIDPNVRHVGTSHLRKLNRKALKEFGGAMVVSDEDGPMVVIVPYRVFISLQGQAGTLEAASREQVAPFKDFEYEKDEGAP